MNMTFFIDSDVYEQMQRYGQPPAFSYDHLINNALRLYLRMITSSFYYGQTANHPKEVDAEHVLDNLKLAED